VYLSTVLTRFHLCRVLIKLCFILHRLSSCSELVFPGTACTILWKRSSAWNQRFQFDYSNSIAQASLSWLQTFCSVTGQWHWMDSSSRLSRTQSRSAGWARDVQLLRNPLQRYLTSTTSHRWLALATIQCWCVLLWRHFHSLPPTTMLQISCTSSSHELADRQRFRNYFQMLITEADIARGFFSIINQFGWRKVAFIEQDENLFTVVSCL